MGQCLSCNAKATPPAAAAAASTASAKTPSNNRDGRSFTKRCAALAKEHRARFYILRRCVTMLLCWHIYGRD
ncbi:hypothetical protein SUGI_0388810 [Cryptomeria japonica]|nr:hypothetical protein SUGI_0388810 [Cryptomeria japonica]